jgi:hypothetical protein
MKHGDQAKKAAKAVKASGKKTSPKEALAKSSKDKSGAQAKSSSGKEAVAAKSSGKAPAAKVPAKAAAKAETGSKAGGGNGKAKAPDGPVSFANPVVANAFKRAVKKYPNAFRRLTD